MGRPDAVEKDEGQHSSKTVYVEKRMSIVLFPCELGPNIGIFFWNFVVVDMKASSCEH
jgi:hypothetical protein